MKFYELTYSHMGGRTFPWASGYGPLSQMPFFEGMQPIVFERRLHYWKVNPAAPGMEIDPGGRSWSDMIGCGLGSPNKFVSENLIRDLNESGICILRATEMPIARIMAKALQKIPAPKYYVLEAVPGIEIWSESVSVEDQIAARKEIPSRYLPPYRIKCKVDTWNGSELFSPSNGRGATALYCTERVKELSERKGWTNVEFNLLEMVD